MLIGRWITAALVALAVAACGGPAAPTETAPPAPVARSMVANCHTEIELSGAITGRSAYWGWMTQVGRSLILLFSVDGAGGPAAANFVADPGANHQARLILFDAPSIADYMNDAGLDAYPEMGAWGLPPGEPVAAPNRVDLTNRSDANGVAEMSSGLVTLELTMPANRDGDPEIRVVGTADCGESQFDFSPRPSGSG